MRLVILLIILSLLATTRATSAEGQRVPSAAGKTASFSQDPQRILLIGRVSPASLAKVESFIRSEILPAIGKSGRVVSVKSYTSLIGGEPMVAALVELNTIETLSASSALDILSAGEGSGKANELVRKLSSFFDSGSTALMIYRPDLSLSPGMGSFVPGSKSKR